MKVQKNLLLTLLTAFFSLFWSCTPEEIYITTRNGHDVIVERVESVRYVKQNNQLCVEVTYQDGQVETFCGAGIRFQLQGNRLCLYLDQDSGPLLLECALLQYVVDGPTVCILLTYSDGRTDRLCGVELVTEEIDDQFCSGLLLPSGAIEGWQCVPIPERIILDTVYIDRNIIVRDTIYRDVFTNCGIKPVHKQLEYDGNDLLWGQISLSIPDGCGCLNNYRLEVCPGNGTTISHPRFEGQLTNTSNWVAWFDICPGGDIDILYEIRSFNANDKVHFFIKDPQGREVYFFSTEKRP